MTRQSDLPELRQRISNIDDEILSLIHERMVCSRKVGQFKQSHGLPVKDYSVEKQIIEKVRHKANAFGLHEDLAESIFKCLIEYSCRTQDELMKSSSINQPKGQFTIFIVGGKGFMGRWLCEFFQSAGHHVIVYDPAITSSDFPSVKSLTEGVVKADFIVLATPLSNTAEVIQEISSLRPKGVLVEICSLKSPIISELEQAAKSGIRIASIHPMFGSGVKTLAGRNILLCTHKTHEDPNTIKEILSHSSANIIEIPIMEHDTLMSYVLGSAHILNLIYAGVVRRSPFSLKRLMEVSGTTFRQQLEVTGDVICENQDLYFDIQALNNKTDDLFESFETSLSRYRTAIRSKNKSGFKDEMTQSFNYFSND